MEGFWGSGGFPGQSKEGIGEEVVRRGRQGPDLGREGQNRGQGEILAKNHQKIVIFDDFSRFPRKIVILGCQGGFQGHSGGRQGPHQDSSYRVPSEGSDLEGSGG